jgi:hypothetical protein
MQDILKKIHVLWNANAMSTAQSILGLLDLEDEGTVVLKFGSCLLRHGMTYQ